MDRRDFLFSAALAPLAADGFAEAVPPPDIDPEQRPRRNPFHRRQ